MTQEMTQDMKQQIDAASYQDLLEKWRFEPIGSRWFSGETGEYFTAAMKKKRRNISPGQQIAASKAVGHPV